MESAFGLPEACLQAEDLFVVKYESTGQPGLAAHEDSSEWSFVAPVRVMRKDNIAVLQGHTT